MKMKEFRPRGRMSLVSPLDPPMPLDRDPLDIDPPEAPWTETPLDRTPPPRTEIPLDKCKSYVKYLAPVELDGKLNSPLLNQWWIQDFPVGRQLLRWT